MGEVRSARKPTRRPCLMVVDSEGIVFCLVYDVHLDGIFMDQISVCQATAKGSVYLAGGADEKLKLQSAVSPECYEDILLRKI